jgi:hypothetical protein
MEVKKVDVQAQGHKSIGEGEVDNATQVEIHR